MKSLGDSSVIVRWVRRVASSSVICAVLAALLRPVLRLQRVWERLIPPPSPERHQLADARLVAMSQDVGLLRVIERCLRMPGAAWRHLEADGVVGRALQGIRALEAWQRVRLLGWMLLVALLAFRGLVGFEDGPLERVGLAVWGGLLALALGLMWGCRAVAASWVHRQSR